MARFQLVAAAFADGYASAASVSCSGDGPLSCHNSTAVDTCCFNYPGGQLLQTQFWDTDPATGPSDSWTLHGLWPDNCDGTYEQFCDSSREYKNITEILQSLAPDTLKDMQTYWKDYQGDDESFWEHEFGKHGTCISTLDPACYDDYRPTQEAADYFTRAVGLFKTLPSYEWLAAAGIVPSADATYTLAAIQAALTAKHGHSVVVNCNSKGELDELWYHFNTQGSVQTGQFVAADPVGSPSTCSKTGIKYLPKPGGGSSPSPSPTSTTTTTTTTTSKSTSTSTAPTPTGTVAPFSGKGYLNVVVDGAQTGFLISGGKWLGGGGTPATYTATPKSGGSDGSFTLATSKGSCAVVDDALTCGATVSAAGDFTSSSSSEDEADAAVYLAYGSSPNFYAAAVPTGQTQGTVYTTSKAVSLKLTWQAL